MFSKKTVDTITIGFALFATFFGAGNLILPPILGLLSGDAWTLSSLGFIITGVLTTFLGIMAVVFSGNNFVDLGNRINPQFSMIISIIIMLIIGPLVAVPRTGATTFEIGIEPLFPQISPIVSAIIFFGLTFLLALSASKVVDIIGRYLTPFLLITLLTLIIIGILNPNSTEFMSSLSNLEAFKSGFREGYQTMDALGSFVIISIIISSIIQKGYDDDKNKKNMTIKAGLIAMSGLAIIYGGLVYLGATSGYPIDGEVKRTELLLHISRGLLGTSGTAVLSFGIALACLTTAIALSTAAAQFFSDLSKNKIGYKTMLAIVCLVSGYLSIAGVDKIIQYAFPFLALVYPITVTMALYIVFFGKKIRHRAPYVAAIVGTFLVAAMELTGNLGLDIPIFKNILSILPLADYEIPWLIPSAVGFFLTSLLVKGKVVEGEGI